MNEQQALKRLQQAIETAVDAVDLSDNYLQKAGAQAYADFVDDLTAIKSRVKKIAEDSKEANFVSVYGMAMEIAHEIDCALLTKPHNRYDDAQAIECLQYLRKSFADALKPFAHALAAIDFYANFGDDDPYTRLA